MEIHEILRLAANDSEQAYLENFDREPSMRMSRAGLPLLQLVMEDFIIPKLPVLSSGSPKSSHAEIQKTIRRNMAISSGYLFEKAVGGVLPEEYPEFQVYAQHKLEYKGITGTCDFLLVDELQKKAIVIECKALDVQSLTEAKENKLLIDNWGYLTQMCLYVAAVQDKYPEFSVECQWRLWAKKISKAFTYKPTIDNFASVVSKAEERANNYDWFKRSFEAKSTTSCLDSAFSFDDPLPLKTFHYGHLAASCGLHFSPWSSAILDEDGLLRTDAEDNLKRMLEFVFTPEPTKQQLLSLMRLVDTDVYSAV